MLPVATGCNPARTGSDLNAIEGAEAAEGLAARAAAVVKPWNGPTTSRISAPGAATITTRRAGVGPAAWAEGLLCPFCRVTNS